MEFPVDHSSSLTLRLGSNLQADFLYFDKAISFWNKEVIQRATMRPLQPVAFPQ
jgi:hypothetical protein